MRSFLFSLLGGLLIGGASVLLLVGLGRIAGISGITFGLLE
ncbi:YeeE/YedE family protein, partial [Klebsiella pneumoniae]|nr:YeeE/YedE family protein [Klebsiella pneumoniae]